MKRKRIDTQKPEPIALLPQDNPPLPPPGHPKRQAAIDALQPTSERRRRFDVESLNEFATLAAKRFTDEEICAKLNWNLKGFRRWKGRMVNNEKLSALVIRARQAKLQAHLDNIEEASKGEGAHARADWRASAHIMEVMDRTRFGRGELNAGSTTNNTAIVIAAGGEEQLKKLVAMYAGQAAPEVKALTAVEVTTEPDSKPESEPD